jgi:hypothetical protein
MGPCHITFHATTKVVTQLVSQKGAMWSACSRKEGSLGEEELEVGLEE